jgi:hypothetical protein
MMPKAFLSYFNGQKWVLIHELSAPNLEILLKWLEEDYKIFGHAFDDVILQPPSKPYDPFKEANKKEKIKKETNSLIKKVNLNERPELLQQLQQRNSEQLPKAVPKLNPGGIARPSSPSPSMSPKPKIRISIPK